MVTIPLIAKWLLIAINSRTGALPNAVLFLFLQTCVTSYLANKVDRLFTVFIGICSGQYEHLLYMDEILNISSSNSGTRFSGTSV